MPINLQSPCISRSDLDPYTGFDFEICMGLRNVPNGLAPFGKFQDFEMEVGEDFFYWKLRQGIIDMPKFKVIFDLKSFKTNFPNTIANSPKFTIRCYNPGNHYAFLPGCVMNTINFGLMPGRRIAVISAEGISYNPPYSVLK